MTARASSRSIPARYSALSHERAGGDLATVREDTDLKIAEHVGNCLLQLAQTLHRQRADLHVSMFSSAHGDEVPPSPIVAGYHDARLSGIGQHRPSRLASLFAAQRGVGLISKVVLQPGEQLVVSLLAGPGCG